MNDKVSSEVSMISKRKFLIASGVFLAAMATALLAAPKKRIKNFLLRVERLTAKNQPLYETHAEIFVAKNGTPQENVEKVIQMMGGIERFIGVNDIVILKPNAQWWNQGRTNLAAMKGFIDLVLGIPGFHGEIIIGENHHFMDESLPENEKDNVRGWVHMSEINGDIDGVNHNLNSLISLYHDQGVKNVTKSHWRNGGPRLDVWGSGQNGGVVGSPAEGDGYIWSNIDYVFEGLWGMRRWPVKMTYPVFTSSYSGITVDFKDGAYQRDGQGGGRYIKDKTIKFINFPVLNDHGMDTGTTSAIKNYMGITDLSCGWWGLRPEGYVNVHACGSDYYEYAKAGPLGYFMKTIRKADLNIVTAEWVGWGCRSDITKASHMRTILAGIDPVALDYHGAKHYIFPKSRNKQCHDPDYADSAIRRFLVLAQSVLGKGALSEEYIECREYDFNKSGHEA
jgi:hypothetical protein